MIIGSGYVVSSGAVIKKISLCAKTKSGYFHSNSITVKKIDTGFYYDKATILGQYWVLQ